MRNIDDFFNKRFGMFIHWGAYSVLAGEYNGRNVKHDLGEWIMNILQIPVSEYENVCKMFKPGSFNAKEWVKLAKDAGMGYIVITSKHHDGFALFRSEADPYNVHDYAGYGRDLIGELAQACKEYDMPLGFYYSQALDWHEEDAGGWDMPPGEMRRSWGNVWDWPDNSIKDFSKYFNKKVLPQVKEILTGYGDVFLIWFDTPRTISRDESSKLYDFVKELQPHCLVNSRIGNGLGDYRSLGDNQIPAVAMEFPNETPVTLNDTWGYKSYDHNWKSSEELIHLLAKVASRNVNMLLNIGPKSDGTLTDETVDILKGIGAWMDINREAVQNVRGNPSVNDHDKFYMTVSIKENKLYLIFKENVAQTVKISGLKNDVANIYSLENGREVLFEKTIDMGLVLNIPETDSFMPAYVMVLDKKPDFTDEIMQQGEKLILHPCHGTIFDSKEHSGMDLLNVNLGQPLTKISLDRAGLVKDWNRSGEYIKWKAVITEPGVFNIALVTSTLGISETMREEAILKVSVTVEGEVFSFDTNLKASYVFKESRSSYANERAVTNIGRLFIYSVGEIEVLIELLDDIKIEGEHIPLEKAEFTKIP